MMNWLIGESELLGIIIQNWMLLIGGGLALYIAVLAIVRRRQVRVR